MANGKTREISPEPLHAAEYFAQLPAEIRERLTKRNAEQIPPKLAGTLEGLREDIARLAYIVYRQWR